MCATIEKLRMRERGVDAEDALMAGAVARRRLSAKPERRRTAAFANAAFGRQ
jgi:hypothetical protein